MGRMQRTKGHSFERTVAEWFREAGFPDARRQLEYHVKDALGVDLQGTEPFLVQCKRGKTYAPINAILEIKADDHAKAFGSKRCKGTFKDGDFVITKVVPGCPVLITKADRSTAMAVLPAEEFFKLVRLAYDE